MTTSLTFDAAWLARAWLSVAEASSKDTARPALNRTVCVEFYDDGVRLVATDSYMLLTAWVPTFEHTSTTEVPPSEPDDDELPGEVVVAIDEDGRAKGLFTYLLALANGKDKPEVLVKLAVGASPETSLGMFDGLAGDVLTIAAEDREALLLAVYEGEFPRWRPLVGKFHAAMRSATFGVGSSTGAGSVITGSSETSQFATSAGEPRRWTISCVVGAG